MRMRRVGYCYSEELVEACNALPRIRGRVSYNPKTNNKPRQDARCVISTRQRILTETKPYIIRDKYFENDVVLDIK